MKKIEVYRNFINLNFIRLIKLISILIFVSYILVLITKTYLIKSELLSSDTFNINFQVINRLIFLLSFTFILVIDRLNFFGLKLRPLFEQGIQWYKSIIYISIFCIYIKYCNDLLFGNLQLNTITNVAFVLSILIIIDIKGLFKNISNVNIVPKSNAFLYLFTLAILLWPIFDSHYINEESVVNKEIYLPEYGSEISGNLSKNLYIALTDPVGSGDIKSIIVEIKDPSRKISTQIEYIKKTSSQKNEINSILFPTIINKDKYDLIKTRFDGSNITNLCFFASEVTYSKCIQDINSLTGFDVLGWIDLNIPKIYSEEVKKGVYRLIDREKDIKELSSIDNVKILNLPPLIGLMNGSVRGIFFHHYHAFTEKGYDFNFPRLFTNQYGLGPIIYIDFVKNIFDFKIYDAIIFGIIIANLYIFFLIISISLFIKKKVSGSVPELLIFGLLIYISYVYFPLKLEAPSLYGIRFLPHITLLLLALIPIAQERLSKFYAVGLYCIYFISIFYNFEYGLFLALSAIIAALSINKYKWIPIFLLPIGGYLFLKYYYSTPTATNNLFYYYLSGIGFSGGIKSEFKIISIMLLLLMYVNNKINFKNNTQGFFIIIIFYFFCFSAFKGFWSGDQYQLASTFFFLFIYLYSLSIANIKSIDFGFFKISNNKINIVVCCLSVLLVISPVKKYFEFNYDKNLRIQYRKNIVSDYWLTDRKIEDKINQIKILDTDNDLKLPIISPSDSTYSLYFEKPIDGPFSDLSTFLINRLDVNTAFDYFKSSKVSYIIIDRYLLDDPNDSMPYINRFTAKYTSGYVYNYKYQMHLIDLANNMVNSADYQLCGKTLHFIKICHK